MKLEVGRALAEARIICLFNKAWAREWHIPDLFCNVFKSAKIPSPKNEAQARPTSNCNHSELIWAYKE
jgi:hypothetical protein